MNEVYLLTLILILAAFMTGIVIVYLASKSTAFDWSCMDNSWYLIDDPDDAWQDINRCAEPFRYALKVARMNLTQEEERTLREASKSGGFDAFKRSIDLIEACRERGASPEEYSEHHQRKDKDMR